MTPLECAQDLAAFMKVRFADYGGYKDEVTKKIAEIDAAIKEETDEDRQDELKAEKKKLEKVQDEPIRVYAGFLPEVTQRTADKLCPAVVIRPYEVTDGLKESTASIVAYVTTYDEDMMFGCMSLYHLLEKLRFELLTNNSIDERWQIKDDTMKTVVPEEQPYPIWWGRLTFDVSIPKPNNKKWINQFTR